MKEFIEPTIEVIGLDIDLYTDTVTTSDTEKDFDLGEGFDI